jgi:hypothetical protein
VGPLRVANCMLAGDPECPKKDDVESEGILDWDGDD